MSAPKQVKMPSNKAEYRNGVVKGLTFKQRKFAEYYIISGNKGEAAAKAGYSAKTSSLQGRVLYHNPTVHAYIEYLIADQGIDIMASIEEAKRRMSLGIRGELLEDVVVMIKKEKTHFDKAGKKVTSKTEEPLIIQKRLATRDQISAGELYMKMMKTPTQAESNNEPDDPLTQSIKQALGGGNNAVQQ
jgi:phage terminase small subunit